MAETQELAQSEYFDYLHRRAIGGNTGKGALIGAVLEGCSVQCEAMIRFGRMSSAYQQWAQQNVRGFEQNRSSWVRAVLS